MTDSTRGSWAAVVIGEVCVTVVGLLRSSVVEPHGGGFLTTTSSPTPPLRPPLASSRLQLLCTAAAARVQWVSSFVGKNLHHGVCYL
jgi:hypothetical protein